MPDLARGDQLREQRVAFQRTLQGGFTGARNLVIFSLRPLFLLRNRFLFPIGPDEVVAFAAQLLGVAPPPLVPLAAAGLSPMAQSFYGESKRIDNGRIKRELGVVLRYPSYRDGLRALLAGSE